MQVENILVGENGQYVLCDFGSATGKVLSTGTHNAASIIEEIEKYTTLSYRAPEMVDVYSGRAITTKADIWVIIDQYILSLSFFRVKSTSDVKCEI